MEKIVILKDKANFIRRDGVQVRVAPDVNEALESIRDETGLAKTKVLDVILRKALVAAEIIECEV
jgi:hypothetical protein